MDKQLELTNFINCVKDDLEKIKNDLDKEINSEYFSLSCIAYRMEIFSIGGMHRRRRGKLDTDSENELS